jgi:hypothetical protein
MKGIWIDGYFITHLFLLFAGIVCPSYDVCKYQRDLFMYKTIYSYIAA